MEVVVETPTVTEPAWTKEYEDYRALLALVANEMRVRGEMLAAAVADPSNTRTLLIELGLLTQQLGGNLANIGKAAKHMATSCGYKSKDYSEQTLAAWAAPFPGMLPENNMSPELTLALRTHSRVYGKADVMDLCTEERKPEVSVPGKVAVYRTLLRFAGKEFASRGLQIQEVATNLDTSVETLTDMGSMFGQLCTNGSKLNDLALVLSKAAGCAKTISEDSKDLWRSGELCTDGNNLMSPPLTSAFEEARLAFNLSAADLPAPRSPFDGGDLSKLAMLAMLLAGR